MTQLANLPTSYSPLRSMLDNFWNNNLFDDETIKRNWIPAVNVKETDKNYEIEMAVPGMKKEDFKVDVENGILSISAEAKEQNEKKEGNYTRREFSFNSFQRSFSLPQNVDEGNIKARYDNGVLFLTIAKQQEQQPKKKSIPLS